MPDKLITRKQELIESLKKGMVGSPATAENTSPTTGVVPPPHEGRAVKGKGGEDIGYVIGSELDAAKKIAQLPTSMQAKYNDLPKTAQRALIK